MACKRDIARCNLNWCSEAGRGWFSATLEAPGYEKRQRKLLCSQKHHCSVLNLFLSFRQLKFVNKTRTLELLIKFANVLLSFFLEIYYFWYASAFINHVIPQYSTCPSVFLNRQNKQAAHARLRVLNPPHYKTFKRMPELLGHVNLIGKSELHLNSMTGRHPGTLKWQELRKKQKQKQTNKTHTHTTGAVTNVC